MAELWRAIPGDLYFIRQCFGEQAASVFAAMVVNNTAYCFRCGFKWNFQEPAQGQVQNVWNIINNA